MTSMTLEHTIKRAGGSEFPMPPSKKNPSGKTYKFAPAEDSNGAHICEVTDSAHLTKFLQVPTFVMFEVGDEEVREDDEGTVPADTTGNGDGGEGTGGGEGEGAAPQTLSDSDDETSIDILKTPEEVAELSDGKLAALHTFLFDRKPHGQAKRETIEAAVNAEIEERTKAAEE